jgi:hypothetical protein
LNEKGSSLLLVIAVGLMLSLSVFSLNHWLNRDRLIKEFYATDEKAYYLAEAGIEHVLWHLVDNYYWANQTVSATITAHSSYSVQIVKMEKLIPPPSQSGDPQGLIKVEISSIGTYRTGKERIFTAVDIYYALEGEVFYHTISWERRAP